jgi:hypothetical protein
MPLFTIRAAILFLLVYFVRLEPLWALILPARPQGSGSGDTLFDWYRLAGVCILTLAATLVWSILERGRFPRPLLAGILTSLTRYILGATMIGYGLAKVIPSQFTTPSADALMRSYADSSPMGLL